MPFHREPPKLMTLPAEIRLLILAEVLDLDDRQAKENAEKDVEPWFPINSNPPLSSNTFNRVGLPSISPLLINKTIYGEVKSLNRLRRAYVSSWPSTRQIYQAAQIYDEVWSLAYRHSDEECFSPGISTVLSDEHPCLCHQTRLGCHLIHTVSDHDDRVQAELYMECGSGAASKKEGTKKFVPGPTSMQMWLIVKEANEDKELKAPGPLTYNTMKVWLTSLLICGQRGRGQDASLSEEQIRSMAMVVSRALVK